jgi:hypothetical protein
VPFCIYNFQNSFPFSIMTQHFRLLNLGYKIIGIPLLTPVETYPGSASPDTLQYRHVGSSQTHVNGKGKIRDTRTKRYGRLK